MTEPSKVIHVRNVDHEITENDLLQLVQPFGSVTKLVMLRTKNQALVQMEDMATTINLVDYYTNVQPTVRGRNVYMQFSSHQELTTDQTQGRKSDMDGQPNRILLVSIHNVLYQMTVDVLHQVFSPYGFVEKIVTFQKSAGFQALVQYETRQNASSAMSALHARNIYDGCCQLDIQYSNLTELQVNYNNDRSRHSATNMQRLYKSKSSNRTERTKFTTWVCRFRGCSWSPVCWCSSIFTGVYSSVRIQALNN